LLNRYSNRIQVRPADAAAVFVLIHAMVAKEPDVRAEPPLNPNHPNQRRQHPNKVYATLRGSSLYYCLIVGYCIAHARAAKPLDI
jgi:hypothetical protein